MLGVAGHRLRIVNDQIGQAEPDRLFHRQVAMKSLPEVAAELADGHRLRLGDNTLVCHSAGGMWAVAMTVAFWRWLPWCYYRCAAAEDSLRPATRATSPAISPAAWGCARPRAADAICPRRVGSASSICTVSTSFDAVSSACGSNRAA